MSAAGSTSSTPASSAAAAVLAGALARRLDPRGRTWLEERRAELEAGVDDARFAAVLSLASRFAPRSALAPDASELAAAQDAREGWNIERWSVLEALRVALVLARPDLAEESPAGGTSAGVQEGFARALEGAFRYADEGELRALYRSLALLPDRERFLWRAKEGCRTNIVPVFEAVATDNPYPFEHFDDVAWRQLAIKAVFIGAPLWRVYGLDRRLSPELARMALDLADERRSAGRPVQPELWLCLGSHAGRRGLESLDRELAGSSILGRQAAAYALARAGGTERLAALAEAEPDPDVARAMRAALAGTHDQTAFGALHDRT